MTSDKTNLLVGGQWNLHFAFESVLDLRIHIQDPCSQSVLASLQRVLKFSGTRWGETQMISHKLLSEW